MTDAEQPAPALSALDARLQLEVAVQQLLTPVVEPVDRSRPQNDPAVAAVAEQDATEHTAHMTRLRTDHAHATAAKDKAGMRRAVQRMLTLETDYRRRQQDRTRDRAYVPSLLTRLQAAVESTQGAGNRSSGVHRSPIGLDAAELLGEIERTVRGPGRGGLLHSQVRDWAWAAAHGDLDTLCDAAARSTRWVDLARTILEPDRTAEVQGACPVCGERYVWMPADDGTRIRVAALQLTYATRSARCRNPRCDGHWSAEYLPHLADVIEQDRTEREATG